MSFTTPKARAPFRTLVAAVSTLVAMLAVPVSAHAGRLLVTGHDADQHCAREAVTVGSCHFFSTAVTYVRGGAPDPTKPVLVLDRANLDVEVALKKAFPTNTPAYQVVDPRSPDFASLPINTATYSAIIVASSKDNASDAKHQDLNEFGSTPDTDAINARADAIRAFFDAGGGVFVNSGGEAGRADSATYYHFLGLTRAGAVVREPLSLTSVGTSIGFQDQRKNPSDSNDINCCVTHMSFELPAPEVALKVAELDRNGKAVTLIADTAHLSNIEEPPADPTQVFDTVPGSSGAVTTGDSQTGGGTGGGGGGTTVTSKPACVPKKSLKIQLRRPKGVRFAEIRVYINGKLVKKVPGKRLGVGKKTKAFSVKLSQKKTSRLRIVATTGSGRKLTFRQTYRPC